MLRGSGNSQLKSLLRKFTADFQDSIEIINSHFKCNLMPNIEVSIPDIRRPLYNLSLNQKQSI